MAKITKNITVKFPWWASVYVKLYALFCVTFNVNPDFEMVSNKIVKKSKVVIK